MSFISIFRSTVAVVAIAIPLCSLGQPLPLNSSPTPLKRIPSATTGSPPSTQSAGPAQAPPAKAASQTSPPADKSNPFPHYNDKSRGWHFKEIIPDEEIEEIDPPPPSPSPSPPSSEPTPPPGPKPLSPAWLRENIPKYLDTAIESPTPQNISNYLYLQKFAMDSSERFAANYKRVVLSDVNLDESAAVPTWSAGRQSLEVDSEAKRRKLVSSMSKSWGIWFFFRSDCQPCHLQAPVLASFAKLHGFEVYPISMDGAPMPNSPFPRYVVDRGQAEKLGVQGTPTIVLVRPPDVAIPIAYGPTSMDELQMRVLELSTQYGAITQEQYNSTRYERKRSLPSPSAATGIGSIDTSNPTAVRDYLKSLVSANKN